MDEMHTTEVFGLPPENEPDIARVRRRPGMFIGSTDARGLHDLYTGILKFMLNVSTAGDCPEISVYFHSGGEVTIASPECYIFKDSPTAELDRLIETVITDFTTYSRITSESGLRNRYHLCPANSLSSSLMVDLFCDGSRYRFCFSRGQLIGTPEKIGTSDRQGTAITFTPDVQVFGEDNLLHASVIRNHLQQMAYLHPKVTFRYENTLTDDRMAYNAPSGIAEYVELLTLMKHPSHAARVGHITQDAMAADVAFRYCLVEESTIITFVNDERIYGGGAQERGLLSGMARAMNHHVRQAQIARSDSKDFTPDEMHKGLTAVIALWLPKPEFDHTWRGGVCGVEVEQMVDTLIFDMMRDCPRDQNTTDNRYLFQSFARSLWSE